MNFSNCIILLTSRFQLRLPSCDVNQRNTKNCIIFLIWRVKFNYLFKSIIFSNKNLLISFILNLFVIHENLTDFIFLRQRSSGLFSQKIIFKTKFNKFTARMHLYPILTETSPLILLQLILLLMLDLFGKLKQEITYTKNVSFIFFSMFSQQESSLCLK